MLTKKDITNEEIEKVAIHTEKQDHLLRKDPLNLVLFERNDFTNFTVFCEHYNNDTAMIKDILTYDPNLPKLLVTDSYQPGKQETITRFLLRYIYLIIYYIETGIKEDNKTPQTVENADISEISDRENQDSPNRKSPETFGSPCSFLEIQKNSSSEEEKIEKNDSDKNTIEDMDQGKRKLHSESDDWQIEENSFQI